MAASLLTRYKRDISQLELEPSAGGCFEVSVDDQVVYSKLATGEFPDEPQLVEDIAKRT